MVSGLLKHEVGDLVERCTVLASLLEVSGYPKPGNVHRTSDMASTRFEHFLAASVSIAPAMRKLAIKGYQVGRRHLAWPEVGLGRHIFEASRESLNWQSGGNVNTGIVLLIAPLAAATGCHLSQRSAVSLEDLRGDLIEALSAATSRDSVMIVRAIRGALSPRVLGHSSRFDVTDDNILRSVISNSVTPRVLFEECKNRDTICSEWVTGFSLTFGRAYPALQENLRQNGDINRGIVHTFLQVLSETPDSLIIRKRGFAEAVEVSRLAQQVLLRGGLDTPEGTEELRLMEQRLGSSGGELNPGTTADVIAAAIYLLLAGGWRP